MNLNPTVTCCFVDRCANELLGSNPESTDFDVVLNNARALPHVDFIIYFVTNHERGLCHLDSERVPDNVRIVCASRLLHSLSLSLSEKTNQQLLELYESYLSFGRSKHLVSMVGFMSLAHGDCFIDSDYDLTRDTNVFNALKAGESIANVCGPQLLARGEKAISDVAEYLYREHTKPIKYNPRIAYQLIIDMPKGCPPLRLITAIRKRASAYVPFVCKDFVAYTTLVEEQLIDRGVCPFKNDYATHTQSLFDKAFSLLVSVGQK